MNSIDWKTDDFAHRLTPITCWLISGGSWLTLFSAAIIKGAEYKYTNSLKKLLVFSD